MEIEGRGYHGYHGHHGHGSYGRRYEKVWFQSTQLSVRCRDQIPTNSSMLTVGQNPCMEPVRKIMPKIEVKITLSRPFFPDPTEHWRSIVPLQGQDVERRALLPLAHLPKMQKLHPIFGSLTIFVKMNYLN